jgi:hypothetical protein
MTEATRLPKVTAAADLVPKIRSGLQLAPELFAAPKDVRFQLLDETGSLIAVAHVEGHKVVYDRVFKP